MSDHEDESRADDAITRRRYEFTEKRKQALEKARKARAEKRAARPKPKPLEVDTSGYAEHAETEVVEDVGEAAMATPAPAVVDDGALRAAIKALLAEGSVKQTQAAVKQAVEPARTYGLSASEMRDVIREELAIAREVERELRDSKSEGKSEAKSVVRVAGGRSRKVTVPVEAEESSADEGEAAAPEMSSDDEEYEPRSSRRGGGGSRWDSSPAEVDWASRILG